jgi:hypothetical protein
LDPKGLFCIYRKDRLEKIGGGVIIFVSKGLSSFPFLYNNSKFTYVELVACKIQLNNITAALLCYYAPQMQLSMPSNYL